MMVLRGIAFFCVGYLFSDLFIRGENKKEIIKGFIGLIMAAIIALTN